MKRFLLKNREGQYLNTDYHTSWSQGNWRPRDKARLYRSLQGMRSAFSSITPSVEEAIGLIVPRPQGRWTEDDHIAWGKAWQAYSKIKLQEYFDLIAKDGYVVEVVEI